jgi:uracil-DNA glycosylase family 4
VSGADCPDLVSLREHIGDCHRCPLGLTRTQVVFGVGDPRSRLVFVGEAPGKNEDLTGEPFVGAAGKFLDELLASIGLHRSQVYIANVVKCRQPGNRDPEAIEIETCTPFLARQIELIDPVVIATLGKFAAHWVLQTTAPISALRGRLYRVGGRQVVPVFHPAAALYDGSKRSVLFDDFRRLQTVLQRVDDGRGTEGRGDLARGADARPAGGADADAAWDAATGRDSEPSRRPTGDAPPSEAIEATAPEAGADPPGLGDDATGQGTDDDQLALF